MTSTNIIHLSESKNKPNRIHREWIEAGQVFSIEKSVRIALHRMRVNETVKVYLAVVSKTRQKTYQIDQEINLELFNIHYTAQVRAFSTNSAGIIDRVLVDFNKTTQEVNSYVSL